jgi:hypothetical protein
MSGDRSLDKGRAAMLAMSRRCPELDLHYVVHDGATVATDCKQTSVVILMH